MSRNHDKSPPQIPPTSALVRPSLGNSATITGAPPSPKGAPSGETVRTLDQIASGGQDNLQRRSSDPARETLPISEFVTESDFEAESLDGLNPLSPPRDAGAARDPSDYPFIAFDPDTEPPPPSGGQLELPSQPADPSEAFGEGVGERIIEREQGQAADELAQASVDADVLRLLGRRWANTVSSLAKDTGLTRQSVQERLHIVALSIQFCEPANDVELCAILETLRAVLSLIAAARTLARAAPAATRVELPELIHAFRSWLPAERAVSLPPKTPTLPKTPPAPPPPRAAAEQLPQKPRGRPLKGPPSEQPQPREPDKAERRHIDAMAREADRADLERAKLAKRAEAEAAKAKASRLRELEREQATLRRELAGAPPSKSHKAKPKK